MDEQTTVKSNTLCYSLKLGLILLIVNNTALKSKNSGSVKL